MLPHKHIIRLTGSRKQILCQLKRPGSVKRRIADRARLILWTAEQVTQIKAVASEQPAKLGLPLSRFSLGEIVLWIMQAQIVMDISASSVWRLLHQDALRPWYYRAWLFPRDVDFATKAGRVLDLYQRL